MGVFRFAKNIPSDYSGGITSVLFLGLDRPHESAESVFISGGKS